MNAMKITLALLLAALGFGCGDDGEAEECPDTVEAWCATSDLCDGFETREEALENVFDDEISLLGARSCDEGNTITLGDGFVGKGYSYDDDGALVGLLTFTDASDPGQPCSSGLNTAGQTAICPLDACALIAEPFGDGLPREACTGSVAEPFIAMCRDIVDLEQACETCACTDCYPALLGCARAAVESDAGGCDSNSAFKECIDTECAEPCAALVGP